MINTEFLDNRNIVYSLGFNNIRLIFHIIDIKVILLKDSLTNTLERSVDLFLKLMGLIYNARTILN